jgi:hypothetical protein
MAKTGKTTKAAKRTTKAKVKRKAAGTQRAAVLKGSSLVRAMERYENAMRRANVERFLDKKLTKTEPVESQFQVEARDALRAARVAMAKVCQQNVLAVRVSD